MRQDEVIFPSRPVKIYPPFLSHLFRLRGPVITYAVLYPAILVMPSVMSINGLFALVNLLIFTPRSRRPLQVVEASLRSSHTLVTEFHVCLLCKRAMYGIFYVDYFSYVRILQAHIFLCAYGAETGRIIAEFRTGNRDFRGFSGISMHQSHSVRARLSICHEFAGDQHLPGTTFNDLVMVSE